MAKEINWMEFVGFDQIDTDTGAGITKLPRKKSTCYIQPHFGAGNGLEIVAKNTWVKSFASRSKSEARRILSTENAPQESIDWAKKILNL